MLKLLLLYLLVITITFSLLIGSAHAQNFQVIITEINFKNSEQDFLRFQIKSPQPVNIKGLEFIDDTVFKKIEQDLIVAPDKIITLFFDSDQEDQSAEIHTIKNGLTATTEQLLIRLNAHILDFVCWKNSRPSKTELQDFTNFFQPNLWTINDIQSCLNSDDLDANQSYFRLSKDQWTNSLQALTPNSKTNLLFSEIYPNPQGADKNQEWLEFFHPGKEPASLNGWSIRNNKGKLYSFPEGLTIKPQNYISIPANLLKITLGNKQEKLELVSPDGQVSDQVEYQNAPDQQSLALVNSKWIWTNKLTPNKANPQITNINIVSTSAPNLSSTHYFFTARHQDSQIVITFNEAVLAAPLAKAIITPGTNLQVSGEFLEQNIFTANSFTLSNTQVEQDSPRYTTILNTLFTIILGLIILYIIHRWKTH